MAKTFLMFLLLSTSVFAEIQCPKCAFKNADEDILCLNCAAPIREETKEELEKRSLLIEKSNEGKEREEKTLGAIERRRILKNKLSEAIEQHQIFEGMDMEKVKESWGNPDDIQTTETKVVWNWYRGGNQAVSVDMLDGRYSIANQKKKIRKTVTFENGFCTDWTEF